MNDSVGTIGGQPSSGAIKDIPSQMPMYRKTEERPEIGNGELNKYDSLLAGIL